VKGLVLALQFMTRLPLPGVSASQDDFAASMRWLPATGFVVGGVVAASAWLMGRVDPWVGALGAVVVWVWITGALHLDGLADLADAGGAAHKGRERVLAVLADPHVGSFGVVAIGVQLIAKAVLVHTLLTRNAWVVLVLVPFAARIGPLAWTLWLAPLHQGLAARFRAALRPVHLAGWVPALLVAAWFVPALLVTPVLIAGWGWHVRRRIGGISGDGHGAGIETIESALMLAALVLRA
jgi:adenosylcobinamide-GDP ribazoletransferase